MKRPLLIAGAGLEALFVLLLWLQSPGYLIVAVFIHAAASYLMALGIWGELPRRYKLPWRRSIGFLLALLFIVPVLGAIGLWWALVRGLSGPRFRLERRMRIVPLPELPFSPPVVHARTPYSQGALRQILRFAERPLKRLKAVMATRQMSGREAAPLWQLATRDVVDDVRLLAYAMLDGHEKTLSDRIQSLNEDMAELAPARRGPHHRRIAELCWELVYQRLVHGAVREHWLAEARRHLEAALELTPLAGSWILYGRLTLELGEFAQAKAAFLSAQAFGVDRQSLLPYLAELAYRQRAFTELRALLAESTRSGERGRDWARVQRWWQA